MNNSTIITQSFSVDYKYTVAFTENVFDRKNTLLKEHICSLQSCSDLKTKVLVFVDKNVVEANQNLIFDIKHYFSQYSTNIIFMCDPVLIPGGEFCKNNYNLVKEIYKFFEKNQICRHSVIIVVGGGALIDMVGYCTATAHRGINLIRIPTTLLAQADASIGVKNGINFLNKKNFIGTFSLPSSVINDCIFLETLPDKILLDGIAEAVKVALIKKSDFFKYLEENAEIATQRNKTVIQKITYQCAKYHLQHISGSGDPFEKGNSRPLDFGHWSAHKLEQLSNYTISHGQAVAIGISLDCVYAFLKGYLPESILKRILNLFLSLNLVIFSHLLIQKTNNKNELIIFQGLEEFREHLGGKLTILLIKGIGESFEVNKINKSVMEKAIFFLQKYTN